MTARGFGAGQAGSIAVGCSAMALLCSCELAPKPGGDLHSPALLAGHDRNDGAIHYVNPFEPQRVRVHGLTALTVVNGEPRIDTHLELYDAYGQPVKALGTCVFQLYAGASASGDVGLQLRRWVVDLSDPATNAAAYDRVTRTYRIALTDAPPPEATNGYVLEVQFRSIAGTVISARHAL